MSGGILPDGFADSSSGVLPFGNAPVAQNPLDANRNANVGAFRTASARRIEADPAEARNVSFRPTVDARLLSSAFGKEMADHNACGKPETARARNEDMRKVARLALAGGECFCRTGEMVVMAGAVVEPLV